MLHKTVFKTGLAATSRISGSLAAALALMAGLAGAAAASSTTTTQPTTTFATGKIALVTGSTLEVQSATGQTTVTVSSSTVLRRVETLSASAVKVGACVTASGKASGKTSLSATTVTLLVTAPGSKKGSQPCTFANRGAGAAGRGFGAGGGAPRGGSGSFSGGSGAASKFRNRLKDVSTAFGAVTSTSSSSIKVHGRLISLASRTVSTKSKSKTPAALPMTTVTIKLGKSTIISETVAGKSSDLVAGQCLTAVGPANSIGAIAAVTATVSAPTSAGCTAGGGGFGGGFGGPA
jgi:hypothetical protein